MLSLHCDLRREGATITRYCVQTKRMRSLSNRCMNRTVPIFLAVASVLVSAACATSRTAPPTTTENVTGPLAQIEIFSERLPSGYRVVLARTPAVPSREPRVYIGSYVLHGSMQE